jgi:cytochrome b
MSANSIKVWDLPSRLCHVFLAVSILGAYGTAEWHWLDLQWHFYFGYATLVLVVFRLLWGIWGSEHARFAEFLRGPGAVIAYVKKLISKDAAQTVGHSAVGGWAVVVLLLASFAQAFSGLFNSDDIEYFGPLYDKVNSEWVDQFGDFHESFYNVLIILIGVHILAALLYWLVKKQNLILPMITGEKQLAGEDAAQKPVWLALFTLGLSGVLVWALIRFFPSI